LVLVTNSFNGCQHKKASKEKKEAGENKRGRKKEEKNISISPSLDFHISCQGYMAHLTILVQKG
jgi:hypothetical protein